ncbi:universal stress protein [Virgisporangium aliadipatigenens]|nr:universal stress protein [Virgisporangium aliadipatigenens]
MELTPQVVVGVDGSDPGRAALRLAAAEAARRRSALRVVCAFEPDWPSSLYGASPDVQRLVRERAEQVAREAAHDARRFAPDVEVVGEAVAGDPGEVLIDAADSAGLLVIGHRGHGGFASLMLGAVSHMVAMHARVPVLVARGDTEPGDKPVVVGVDHTSEHAVRAAFEEAATRGCALVAAHAYTVPVAAWPVVSLPIPCEPDVVRNAAFEELNAALAPWRDKFPAVPVKPVAARGSAARMLVGMSSGAAVVVVGSRGHTAAVGTLLGAVGMQLLHHSDCPVLIAH